MQALGGTIVFLPFVFTTPMPVNVTMPAIGARLYMGLGVGFLVYLSFNFALKHLEAGIVALFGNLIPVFTLSSPLPSSGTPRWLKPSVSGSRSWASSLLPCQKNNGNNRTGREPHTNALPCFSPASLTATKPINGFSLSHRHVLPKRSLHPLLPNQSIPPLPSSVFTRTRVCHYR
ncbi:MAG: EamA family transporter [Bilophila wadsworthia]